MSLIRSCPDCGTKNRIPSAHLADTGRCGNCKQPLAAYRRAHRRRRRSLRRHHQQRTSPGAGRLLGGLVRSLPHGRATRGAHRTRDRRQGHRPQGRHRSQPAARCSLQRARHPQLRRLLQAAASSSSRPASSTRNRCSSGCKPPQFAERHESFRRRRARRFIMGPQQIDIPSVTLRSRACPSRSLFSSSSC